jgi:hypothetical protein
MIGGFCECVGYAVGSLSRLQDCTFTLCSMLVLGSSSSVNSVTTMFPEAIPVVGGPLVELLRGGVGVGQATLTRFCTECPPCIYMRSERLAEHSIVLSSSVIGQDVLIT